MIKLVQFYLVPVITLVLAGVTQAEAFELIFEAPSVASFAQPHDITLSSDQCYL